MVFKFIVAIFIVQPALAFVPEYEFFSEGEAGEINSPRLIGSEYQSDKLTYLYPANFHYTWLANDKVFQYSAGSLGPTRFLTRGRVRARFSLSEKLTFQFVWLDRGDYEGERNNFVFDFNYQIIDWLGLSLYGQSQSMKRRDSAGLAVNLGSDPDNQWRLFHNFVYFSHNKRNEGTDTFLQQPNSYGLVWRSLNRERKSFREWSFRHDKSFQQFFPDSGRLYSFEDKVLRLNGQERLSENFDYFEYDFMVRDGHEGDTLNTDQGIDRWERFQAEALFRYRNPNWFTDWVGIKYVYNQWDSTAGSVIHNDVVPHFSIPLDPHTGDAWSLDWRLGYEFTWHRGQGDSSLRSDLDRNNVLEHRANVRMDLWFKGDARLYTLFTFDLDEFGTGETWEGGSMQFSATF